VPDPAFADPRLAEIYDFVDSDRGDLEVYSAMVEEFGASSIVDIGCGTGTFACLLAERGKDVVGIDPAAASLAVGRSKPHAGRVRWVEGTSQELPAVQADLVTMTGNVAQVFLDDQDWSETLRAARAALRVDGLLVFEVRDPAQGAWRGWNREATHRLVGTPAGTVETWYDLTDVNLPFVSFRGTFVFHANGSVLTSDSTLRFRDRQEVEAALVGAGFSVEEVRGAPDRPGKEFVFIARKLGM